MRYLMFALVTLVAVMEFNVNARGQSACTAYFASYLYPFYLLNLPGTPRDDKQAREVVPQKRTEKVSQHL